MCRAALGCYVPSGVCGPATVVSNSAWSCGVGLSTLVLAEDSDGVVTAIDSHEPYLASLRREAAKRGLAVGTIEDGYQVVEPAPDPMADVDWDGMATAAFEGALAEADATTCLDIVDVNEDGDIVRFNGLDIYETELIPGVTGSATTAYPVNGHPVIVGKKGWAIGRGEKIGMRISTEVRPTMHGEYKVVDMEYDQDILVKESIVLLRTAD